MRPSVAARPLFFAASAWPLSRKTFLAPSTSPSDSSSARFTSIIPAAVSSLSCLIFSIVLANVTGSPRYPRFSLLAPLLRRPRALLSRALQLPAPQRPPVRRLPRRPPPSPVGRRPRTPRRRLPAQRRPRSRPRGLPWPPSPARPPPRR